MSNKLVVTGKILFSPEVRTKKHKKETSWKKVAMVMFDGDITNYYAWFLNKRYNIILNPPQRGGHITFINDSIKDISLNDTRSIEEVDELWDKLKIKWDNQTIDVTLDLNPRSNGEHWWLPIPHEDRLPLHSIREEIGLGKPYWGLHMSIGYANEKNIFHSEYINNLLQKGVIP